MYISWIQWDKILISEPTPPKLKFSDQNEEKEDLMKINFGNFQIQKCISQKVRAQKLDEKMESFA